ncbi:hypothetical protein [Mycobacteroides chelonae]|nr:hypothetical protein [Mycobacteroides chelonae]
MRTRFLTTCVVELHGPSPVDCGFACTPLTQVLRVLLRDLL